LDRATAVLHEERGKDPVGAVHQARKEVKKARSLLRLARPGFDKRVYRRENRTLRDGARSVAHVRDADVMVETVDGLRERFVGQLPARAFTNLRRRLKRQADRTRKQAGNELGAELVEALAVVGGRIEDWRLEEAGWSIVHKGIARAYRRGRRAFATADADPTTANLHELRKRVKDLWYQERLLKPAWPAVLGAQADEAHALSDLLGDDHDLAALAERLREEPSEGSDAILELIDKRRAELLARIRALGRRVYAEKPKPFARRLRSYLRSAEAVDPVPA
jgi:CHAD domain-containing protein